VAKTSPPPPVNQEPPPAAALAAALQCIKTERRLRGRIASLDPPHSYPIETNNRFVRHRREAAMRSIEGEVRRWLCKRSYRLVLEAFDAPPGSAPPPVQVVRDVVSEKEYQKLQRQLSEAKRSADGFAMLQQQLIVAKVSIAELNYENEEQRHIAKQADKLSRRQA